MAELYWGTTSAFVAEATQNRIAETLREACIDHLALELAAERSRPYDEPETP